MPYEHIVTFRFENHFRKFLAFFKIIVPNIITGITVSSLLAVSLLFGDYIIIRNLSSTNVNNMQKFLYQAMKRFCEHSGEQRQQMGNESWFA